MGALIEANSLSYQVDGKSILDNVSVSIKEKEILTLIGPNGAGKTTLLRILAGLLKPDSGEVVHSPELKIGFMPQKLHLNTTMPLPVKTFLNIKNVDKALMQNTANELNIDKLIDQSMHSLSGGEKQRVMLARAILRKPNLLILDEPAQGVDLSGQNRLYELISNISKSMDCAVFMISHDLHWVMANTDRVLCLNQHICCEGHPDTVSTDAAYLNLFAEQVGGLAHYTHHHDHHHDLHGDVVEGEHGKGCNHDH
jgi:zinc transport system ATP-binding protein